MFNWLRCLLTCQLAYFFFMKVNLEAQENSVAKSLPMTSKFIPTSPRPRHHKGPDVDKTSPSAKLGDRSLSPKVGAERRSLKPLSCEERSPASRGAEFQQLQDELAKTKEQLALTENSKLNRFQDLVQSKRQVEDLLVILDESTESSKGDRLIDEEMELFSFNETENWQVELNAMKQRYEVAVRELQSDRQTIASLRQELLLCGEARDEAVKLAGEAMNVAESMANRVEELSAELLFAKGYLTDVDNSSCKAIELMDELLAAQQCLAEAMAARDKVAMEGEVLLAPKDVELEKLTDTASAAAVQLENLRVNIACSEKLRGEISSLMYEIDVLKAELNSTKDTRNSAILAMLVIRTEYYSLKVNFDRVNTEVGEMNKMKDSETGALITANENLIEATMKGVAFESYLLFLAKELERSHSHVLDLEKSQASAATLAETLAHELDTLKKRSLKELDSLRLENAALKESERRATASAADVQHQLNKLIETNQSAAMLLEEEEMSVFIAMESLKREIQNLNSAITTLKEGEMLSAKEAKLLRERLECNNIELVDLREKYEVAAARSSELERELESRHRELAALRQQELNMTSGTITLLSELEVQHLESAELKGKVASLDSQAAMLDSQLQRKEMYVVELNRRCICLANRVTALSIVISRLAQTKDCELLAATSKGAAMHTEIVLLNGELVEAKKDRQNAVSTWMSALENSEKLNVSLKKAMAENEVLQQEVHAARAEALQSKEDTLRLSVDLDAAQNKAMTAQEEAQSISLELHSAREYIKALQVDGQIAAQEIEVVRMKLEAALLHAQKTSEELEHARADIEGLRMESELFQSKLQAQETQLKGVMQMAKDEVAKLQAELLQGHAVKEDAQTLLMHAESRLKSALRMNGGIVNVNHVGVCELGITFQDELNHLKMRLSDTQEHLAAVLLELDATRTSKQQLCMELEDIKMENEANRGVILDVQQHLADTEKAKSDMEAEIQRLLDDNKLWQAAKSLFTCSPWRCFVGAIFCPCCKSTPVR